ncbi:MAG: tRNA (5-methylaminomethyl-2-thiouridine)(34)-methyltransferase MnmD [Crocinitomicaceae bacterium]|nr:tRNA (5-methylaminomethyl-2-thiouridine)(34)-methyltransferase MnmD [Crocinitomicaceae bacterium]
MKRTVIATTDGSKTIYIEEMDETYHSSHGAIQEAKHVFIKNGLEVLESDSIRVFELGFGTGLNALLTCKFANDADRFIEYHGIEAFPVSLEMASEMDYPSLIEGDYSPHFESIHSNKRDDLIEITDKFSLKKIEAKIQKVELDPDYYDIVFFDAFGPRAQSEMWEMEILKKMYDALKVNGVLVTYCAQGQFKRNLKALGFTVESLPGPPGKREMTKAIKNN